MIDHEETFLSTVSRALADVDSTRRKDLTALCASEPHDREERLKAYTGRNLDDRRALLEKLRTAALPINLNVIACETAEEAGKSIAELVRDKSPEWGTRKQVTAWNHPLIAELGLDRELSDLEVPLVKTMPPSDRPEASERTALRNDIIDSFVGITSADYCVAETGTLIMKTRPDQPRSVSLVPVIHVAVVRLEQLVENLTELYFRLQWDPREQSEGITNCMTFISGPSKTGDIELVIVHGAHGPRELHLYVITGDAV